MHLKVTIIGLVLLLWETQALPFTGQVVGVLHGIDCPEKGQPFGKVAKWATSALVFGRTVTIQPHDTDRYKRVVAEIVLADATHVNQKLVKDGWCWWYRKYAPDDLVLEGFETE